MKIKKEETLHYTINYVFIKFEYIVIGDNMYKKITLFIVSMLLVIGCVKKETLDENIDTLIEEDKNILVGINYPVTGISALDKLIKNDIEKIYNDFKEEYESFNSLTEKSELNIDYTYDIISDNYINICVNIFIDSSKLTHPYNYMKTYVYDIKNKNLMSIEDLIIENELKQFVSKVSTELIKNYSNCILLDEMKKTVTIEYEFPLFTFDNESITIYFNPTEITASYCGIISINLPIEDFELKIKLKEIKENIVSKEIEIPTKVLDPNQKVIVLTFDDGPSKYTEKIIDYLHEQDVVATFFILGNKVEIYKDTLTKAIEYGNELGNHSYNHKWLTKLEVEEFLLQIEKTQSIIYETLKYKPIVFRPTYGSINSKIRNNVNLDIILWNIDTMDWKYKSVNKIVSRATKNVKDGDIILMHDTYERTYKAVMKIVPILKKQGYQFVTVSELKEINLLRQHKEIEDK